MARVPLLALLGLAPLASLSLPSCGREAQCGDARVDEELGEECDDGNLVETDECTNACKLPRCGDGIISEGAGEECDDGNDDDTDGCTNACTDAVCGDGVVQANVEECDDGNVSDNDNCLGTCRKGTCGDAIVRITATDDDPPLPPEECDDGNDDNTDNCTNDCKNPKCGDGYVGDDEECDDGNDEPNDACPTTCLLPVCGDGFVNPATEECDDGNLSSTDACLPDCTATKCGDGIVQASEECDDGNSNEGDFCSSICKKQCAGGDAAAIFPDTGHCYLYFPGPVTWAQANCAAFDAHLVTIFSTAENTFVQDLLPNDADDAWIGLTDQAFESAWVWQLPEGPPQFPSIEKWAPGQDDDMPAPGADCAIIQRTSGLWYDQPCDEVRGAVCEYEYPE